MRLLNPFIVYVGWNILVIFLYSLGLTTLYDVDVLFIVIYLMPLVLFSILNLNKFNKISKNNIESIFSNKAVAKSFFLMIYLLFVIGVVASIYQIFVFGTPLELENKINRPMGDHYVQYLVNFLQIVSMMAYVAIRFNFGRKKSTILICILSLVLLAVWLNRGAYTPFLVTAFFVEYINAILNNSVKKFFSAMGVLALVFIFIFGYVGSLRMEYVMENTFHTTINNWYGMPEFVPTGFVQLYVYLTSPLENARHMFFEQIPWEYHYGVDMLYPFVAFFLRILIMYRIIYSPIWIIHCL